jgi:NAD(P)-dependent dehydrogenase (short-subunit alcohol dehydrogenase family)
VDLLEVSHSPVTPFQISPQYHSHIYAIIVGLGTARVLLSHGAKVVVGDINECPEKNPDLTYEHLDTSSWESNVKFFKKAIEVHGKIDHVFANAGGIISY